MICSALMYPTAAQSDVDYVGINVLAASAVPRYVLFKIILERVDRQQGRPIWVRKLEMRRSHG